MDDDDAGVALPPAMPTDVLTADADKILAEIATPAKRMGGPSPIGQASPGKFGAGASLADFELMEKLGKGNCGTVHKARRLLDDELYVIKQIDIVALHPDELQQAVVEAQVRARVRVTESAPPCPSLSPRAVGLRGCLSAAGAFSVDAQVLAALDNPYIIQYCDSFIDQDQLNIVMEYAAAGNLHEV
eukprot:COSAG06_NODE_26221_length_619_cov_0.915385_1_plen_186_part_01